MKEKVLKLLVKYGNNPDDAKKMVESKESEWAFKTYATAREIAMAIRSTY
jgi:hypothetical protein